MLCSIYTSALLNAGSSIKTLIKSAEIEHQEGKPIEEKKEIFLLHKDEDFQEAFSKLIKNSYSKLFDLHGDTAWSLNDIELLSFFRATDKTSEIIGKRQAKVFQTFAALSGKSEPPATRPRSASANSQKSSKPKSIKASSSKEADISQKTDTNSPFDHLGMSIKIEVNLPSDASKETYDIIFKSIRENLIND